MIPYNYNYSFPSVPAQSYPTNRSIIRSEQNFILTFLCKPYANWTQENLEFFKNNLNKKFLESSNEDGNNFISTLILNYHTQPVFHAEDQGSFRINKAIFLRRIYQTSSEQFKNVNNNGDSIWHILVRGSHWQVAHQIDNNSTLNFTLIPLELDLDLLPKEMLGLKNMQGKSPIELLANCMQEFFPITQRITSDQLRLITAYKQFTSAFIQYSRSKGYVFPEIEAQISCYLSYVMNTPLIFSSLHSTATTQQTHSSLPNVSVLANPTNENTSENLSDIKARRRTYWSNFNPSNNVETPNTSITGYGQTSFNQQAPPAFTSNSFLSLPSHSKTRSVIPHISRFVSQIPNYPATFPTNNEQTFKALPLENSNFPTQESLSFTSNSSSLSISKPRSVIPDISRFVPQIPNYPATFPTNNEQTFKAPPLENSNFPTQESSLAGRSSLNSNSRIYSLANKQSSKTQIQPVQENRAKNNSLLVLLNQLSSDSFYLFFDEQCLPKNPNNIFNITNSYMLSKDHIHFLPKDDCHSIMEALFKMPFKRLCHIFLTEKSDGSRAPFPFHFLKAEELQEKDQNGFYFLDLYLSTLLQGIQKHQSANLEIDENFIMSSFIEMLAKGAKISSSSIPSSTELPRVYQSFTSRLQAIINYFDRLHSIISSSQDPILKEQNRIWLEFLTIKNASDISPWTLNLKEEFLWKFNHKNRPFLMYFLMELSQIPSSPVFYTSDQLYKPRLRALQRMLAIVILHTTADGLGVLDVRGNSLMHYLISSKLIPIFISANAKQQEDPIDLLSFIAHIQKTCPNILNTANREDDTALDIYARECFVYLKDAFLRPNIQLYSVTETLKVLGRNLYQKGARQSDKGVVKFLTLCTQLSQDLIYSCLTQNLIEVFQSFATQTQLNAISQTQVNVSTITSTSTIATLPPSNNFSVENLLTEIPQVVTELSEAFASSLPSNPPDLENLEDSCLVNQFSDWSSKKQKQVHKIYKELSTAILNRWNTHSIQNNLRILMGLSNGKRLFNLALAFDQSGKLDRPGIRAILQPFIEIYHEARNKRLQKLNTVKSIIQDIIDCLQLRFLGNNQTELQAILQSEGECGAFLLSQLLKQDHTEYASHFNPIVLQDVNSKHAIAIRDFLFYFSLQSLSIRAAALPEALAVDKSTTSSFKCKSAILHYAIQNKGLDKHFVFPLLLIQAMPSGNIQAIGHDNGQTARSLENIVDCHSSEPVEVNEEGLYKIKSYYENHKDHFYLLRPISSRQLTSHSDQDLINELKENNHPLVEEHVSEITPVSPKHSSLQLTIPQEEEKSSPLLKKLKTDPKTQSNTNNHNNADTPATQRSSNEYNTHRSHHLGHLNFSDSFNALSQTSSHSSSKRKIEDKDDMSDSDKPKKRKQIKPNQSLGQYQALSIESNESHIPPTNIASNQNPLAILESHVSLMKIAEPAPAFEGSLLENFLYKFSNQAAERISLIKKIGETTKISSLFNQTESLRILLNAALRTVQNLIYDDPALKRYQRQSIAKISQLKSQGLGRSLCYFAGGGKTKPAIELTRQIQKSHKRPVLIIMPNSLLPQWRESVIERLFFTRYHYYLHLIEHYHELTASQCVNLENAISHFLTIQFDKLLRCKEKISQTTDQIECIDQKVAQTVGNEEENKKSRKDLKRQKKRLEQHLKELKRKEENFTQFFSMSEEVAYKAIQAGCLKLLFNLHPFLAEKESYQALLNQHIDRNRVVSAAFQHLKHLSFQPTVQRIRSKVNLSLLALIEDILACECSYPIQKQQLEAFISTCIGNNAQHPNVEAIKLDDSLLKNNLYKQVITCTSHNKRIPTFNEQDSSTHWKIVLTTVSTMLSLKENNLLPSLENLPFEQVIIDEAHELTWNISDPEAFRRKKKAEMLKNSLAKMNQLHQTAILPLTATPYVNGIFDLLSLLYLANPSLNFSGLANELLVRWQVFESCFSQVRKYGLDGLTGKLQKALKNWLIAVEHVRAICSHLMEVRAPTEESIRQDWTTPEGRVLLPTPDRRPLHRQLSTAQKEIYDREFKKTGLLEGEANLENLLFHPHFLNKWKNKNILEIKKEIKQMSGMKLDAFIKDSSFLQFVFQDPTICDGLANKKKFLFFLPQKKFATVLQVLIKRRYPDIKVKLYNGDEETEIRAGAVHEFEDPNSLTCAMILTPDAGGAGLNLGAADYVVNLAPGWHRAMQVQMEARALRAGRDKVTTIYSFDFGTALEYHKMHTVKVKQLWEQAFLSKESPEHVIPKFIEAFISNFINVSRHDDVNLIKKEVEDLKEDLNSTLEDAVNNLLSQMQDPNSEFAQELMQAWQIISPIETDIAEPMKTTSTNCLTSIPAPPSPLLPKILSSGPLSLQLLPLPVSNAAAAIQLANQITQYPAKISDLMRDLDSLSTTDWNALLENAQQFVVSPNVPPSFYQVQQLARKQARIQTQATARWYIIDTNNNNNANNQVELIGLNVDSSVLSGSPRLWERLTTSGQKSYVMLIKRQ